MNDFHSKNFLSLLRNAISAITFLICFQISFAQNPEQPAVPHDSVKTDDVNYLASPVLSYSPETRLGIGVAGLIHFRLQHHQPEIQNKVSNVTGRFVYTLNKQIISSVTSDLYLHNNADYFNFDFTFYRYPNTFWGIGNNTFDEDAEEYNSRYFILKGNYQRRIFKTIYAGAQWKVKQFKLLEAEENGLLDSGNYLGSEGGFSNGIGLILKFDNRDNDYSTTKGGAFVYSWLNYSDFLGSDYSFNEHRFDLKYFFEVATNHVIAAQVIYRIHDGEVPFHQLAGFGGGYMMRGYYDGRFRDHYSLAAQTEYRFPIWKRLGAAAFISTASVADEMNHFQISEFKIAGGAGLRYKIFKAQDVRLRLDLAVTQDGDFVWYAFFSEAF